MKIKQQKETFAFLQGGGSMGELTRKFDWSKTSVSTPDAWPQSLRTTVGNLLRSRFPMFLWWGNELIQFYNDAYRPSLGNEGKHPTALGQRGEECWLEIWPTIYPLIRQVQQTGEPTWMEDQLIPIYRNGRLEDVYWTFSYSLVLNDDNAPGGVLVTCMETTEAVKGRLQLEDSEARFRNAIEQAPVAFAITRGEDLIFESINPPMLQIIYRNNKQDVLGKRLSDVLPELVGQPVFKIIQNVLQTGETFQGTEVEAELANEGVLQRRYFNITYSRVVDKDGNLSVLHMSSDVTARVTARRKTEESEAKLRTILNSAPTAMGVFVGPDLIVENPNHLLIELMGAGSEIDGRSFRQLLSGLVEEEQKFISLIDGVRTTGQPFEAQEVEVFFKPEKKTRHFNISFLPLRDESGDVYAVLDVSVDVTEQVAARKKVEESEAKFRSLFETMDQGFSIIEIIFDEAGKPVDSLFLEINSVFEKQSGFKSAAGKRIREIVPDIEDKWFTVYGNVALTGHPIRFTDESKVLGKWFEVYALPAGELGSHRVAVLFTDVTERVLSHQRIEESQRSLLNLFEESPVGIATLGITEDFIFEFVNAFYGSLVGRHPEQLMGKPLLEALPELKDQGFDKLLKQVATTGLPFEAKELPARILRDGKLETIYIDFSYHPRKDGKGDITGILAVVIDVTQKVQSRQKIEDSEQYARSLFYNSPIAVLVYAGPDMVLREANEKMLEIFGRGNEIIGKPIIEAIPELSASALMGNYRRVLETGITHQQYEEQVLLVKNGHPYLGYYNYTYKPLYDTAGSIYGVICTAIDVTEQLEARKKVEESEQRFRKLADESPIFVFIMDADLLPTVSYWNKAWLDYTGQTANAAFGRAWSGIIHPDDNPVVMKYYSPAFQSQQPYFIPAIRIKRHDGVYRWHSFKGNPRYLANGEFAGYVGVGFDIHEQKITEEELEGIVVERTEELLQMNKELQRSNANLEEFAHAASHDLKEPIRKIHFFTHQVKEQLKVHLQDTELRSFSRIESATERMGNLIDDLLLYSHVSQRPHETETIDLNMKVQRVMEDLELDIAEKKAVIDVGKLPVVHGYQRQLQQMFQNLISNALKYSRTDAAPRIAISASKVTESNHSYHMITIKDNGIGFDQMYADKIFQMFTRLHGKTEYGGTGVGLSIVKKIVENHHGLISVESAPGMGSKFMILLPEK